MFPSPLMSFVLVLELEDLLLTKITLSTDVTVYRELSMKPMIRCSDEVEEERSHIYIYGYHNRDGQRKWIGHTVRAIGVLSAENYHGRKNGRKDIYGCC